MHLLSNLGTTELLLTTDLFTLSNFNGPRRQPWHTQGGTGDPPVLMLTTRTSFLCCPSGEFQILLVLFMFWVRIYVTHLHQMRKFCPPPKPS